MDVDDQWMDGWMGEWEEEGGMSLSYGLPTMLSHGGTHLLFSHFPVEEIEKSKVRLLRITSLWLMGRGWMGGGQPSRGRQRS